MRQLLEPCLWWRGAKSNNYGSIRRNGKSTTIHRFVYERAFGPQPKLDIHHICENKRCINLEHLEAVTRGEHVKKTKRHKNKWCRRGHDKSITGNRHGQCRECIRLRKERA